MRLSEEILKFRDKHYKDKDVCLLDVIEDYAWEYDIPLNVLGEELKEDELFVELLKKNLLEYNYLRKEDFEEEQKSLW